jgi:hypothetical protein
MADRADYLPIIQALEAAGYHYSLRDYKEHGYQLVCVAKRAPDGRLHGPSFWLSKSSSGQWFLMEWGGETAYSLPASSPAAEVCIACLRQMGSDMRIPEPVIAEYGLKHIDARRIVDFDIIDDSE